MSTYFAIYKIRFPVRFKWNLFAKQLGIKVSITRQGNHFLNSSHQHKSLPTSSWDINYHLFSTPRANIMFSNKLRQIILPLIFPGPFWLFFTQVFVLVFLTLEYIWISISVVVLFINCSYKNLNHWARVRCRHSGFLTEPSS